MEGLQRKLYISLLILVWLVILLCFLLLGTAIYRGITNATG